MSTRNTIILMFITMVVTAGVTRYCFPQIQFKDVETSHEIDHNNIQVVTHTVEKPDGSKEITQTTTDNSIKVESTKKDIEVAAPKNWMFAVGAGTDFKGTPPTYNLQVQRRILGPFFLGGSVSTDKTVGVSLGMEF